MLQGVAEIADGGADAEVADAVEQPYLIVQMKGMKYFIPNYDTHEEFGTTLEEAYNTGVRILVYDCKVTEDTMTVDSELPFRFRHQERSF